MSKHKYAFQNFNKELMARAVGRDLEISPKQTIEICNYLRHRRLSQAKKLLEEVIEEKRAIPFKRFTNGLGHRRGKIASGRYPKKASAACLRILETVEANAQSKGLNTSKLRIIHLCAHRAHEPLHQGRSAGRACKRAHLEIVVQELAEDSKKVQKDEKGKK